MLYKDLHMGAIGLKQEKKEVLDFEIPLRKKEGRSSFVDSSLESNQKKEIRRLSQEKEEKGSLSQDQGQEHLLNAKNLMDYKEYDLASNLLEGFLKEHPSHAYALRLTSLCFKSLNRPHEFLTLLKRLMQMSPLTVEKALLYADILRECGWNKEAKCLYLKCLNMKGEEEETLDSEVKVFFHLYKNLGDLSLKMHSVDEAERYYLHAFKMNPFCEDLWVSLGTLEMKKDRTQRALSYYRKAVEKNPDHAMAWMGLALIHREYGDIELAWGNLARALDTKQASDFALTLALKWAYQDSKEEFLISVLKNLKIFKEKDKEERSVKLHFILAKTLYRQGRYKQALEEMNVLRKEKKLCKGVLGMEFVLKEALRVQSQFFASAFS